MQCPEVQAKPIIVYLHRYPPEVEALQWPAFRPLMDLLVEKYRVCYVSMRCPGAISLDVRRGLECITLPFAVDYTRGGDKWIKTGLYYLALPYLMGLLKKMRPALILCKEPLPFVPSLLARLNLPMCLHVGDWWLSILLGDVSWVRPVVRRLERWEVRSWKRARVLAACSTGAEIDLLERRGMPRHRMRQVNNAMNSAAFMPLDYYAARTRLNLPERYWHVAIHGIIRRGKGYEQLLRWWREVVNNHPYWRLNIIGGAGGENWCRESIVKLGLQANVSMTGWLPAKQDVNLWLNAMDCLLVIRRNSEDNEGVIPSALFNSMSTGRPVVATGLRGLAEIIRDGVDGYLFTPDDLASFRKTLEYVAAHREEAERVGRNGLERARDLFDPEQAARQFAELISEMTAST